MSFSMSCLATRTQLAVPCHHAPKSAKRFFGIPDFRYYAIADGIREILEGRQAPPFRLAPTLNDASGAQLDLFLTADPQPGKTEGSPGQERVDRDRLTRVACSEARHDPRDKAGGPSVVAELEIDPIFGDRK